MGKIKVVIFPAGAENALEIYNSLKYNLHLEIFGISSKSDHAKYIYPENNYIQGKFNINDEGFLERLNTILEELDIDIIIPTHDTVALYLAENKEMIHAKVLTSDKKTARIAREKRLTYDLFKGESFCPKIFLNPAQIATFPVIIKPNIGEGAKNIFKVTSKKNLDYIMSSHEDMLISEFLPGDELTVDCFTNRQGELLFIGPRTRERIQMGISFRSQSVALSDEMKHIAETINNRLSFRGAWFFQIKKDSNNNYKLLEVSIRQAGTMALFRQLGVNFALLGIFDLLEKDVEINKNNFEITLDRCLYNRYSMNYEYDKVYIDLDDTLIVKEKVNTTLIQFIYQCINQSKKVFLITKHEKSVEETLLNYRISSIMFDGIIHLKIDEKKSDFINPDKAILIDNYFMERKQAKNLLSIPVFDVDAVESLLL